MRVFSQTANTGTEAEKLTLRKSAFERGICAALCA